MVSNITSAMHSTSNSFISLIPSLHSNVQEALVLSQRGTTIFRARGELTRELIDLIDQPLGTLKLAFQGAADSTLAALESLGKVSFPGTNLDVEQRKLIAIFMDMRLVLLEGIESMSMLHEHLVAN